MKLTDAKMGQWMRLPQWPPGAWVTFDINQCGRLLDEEGEPILAEYIDLTFLTRDDWEQVDYGAHYDWALARAAAAHAAADARRDNKETT